MWLVRPAQPGDLNDILDIAGGQGPRMSSTLPKKQDALSAKIEQSTRSFAGTNKPDEPKRFLFVLEDTGTGKVQGVSGIDARAGNGQPFYNYRQDALIHASHELGVSRRVEVLYPSHALTDHTLLCSFAIRSELRGTDAFELLSRARMLLSPAIARCSRITRLSRSRVCRRKTARCRSGTAWGGTSSIWILKPRTNTPGC